MKLFLAFSSAVILLFSVACKTMEIGVPQEVVILSFPGEASVYINGEAAGVTPVQASLPRKMTHEVRLVKAGYNPSVKYFTPVENERGKALITFGLVRDFGYYVDLSPNPMEGQLRTDLLPQSRGVDPFEEMAKRVLEADRRLQDGEISALEHRVITEQILSFFER
jgi:hypothetical protein